MADKRVFGLTNGDGTVDNTWSIITDKSGETEALELTIEQLNALLTVNTVKTSINITPLPAQTITNIQAEKLTFGSFSLYNIAFDYASSGETNPEFTLSTGSPGRTIAFHPVLCTAEVSSNTDSYPAYMTGSTPDRITVKGNFQTAKFRFVISMIE